MTAQERGCICEPCDYARLDCPTHETPVAEAQHGVGVEPSTCGDEFSSVEIEGNPPEPFRCGLVLGHSGYHTAFIQWGEPV